LKIIFDKIKSDGKIIHDEMEVVKFLLIKQSQTIFHSNEKNNVLLLKQLGARIDKQGIIRCCGRFKNSDLDKVKRYPILLPRKDRLTELLELHVHSLIKHFGVNHTLCEVRQQFWIPRGRSEVKRILCKCLICRKYSANPYPFVAMFCNAGWLEPPLNSVLGSVPIKGVYLRVRACPTPRLAPALRHRTRLAKPNQQVKHRVDGFSQRMCHFAMATLYLVKEFVYSPWQGGFYERLNSLIKSCLRKSFGRKFLGSDSFIKLLCEIESVINSRPLTYISVVYPGPLASLGTLPINFSRPAKHLTSSLPNVNKHWPIAKCKQTLDHCQR